MPMNRISSHYSYRPEREILYLFPRKLDIPAFISRLENQVLQHLAVTWPTAKGWYTTTSRPGIASIVKFFRLETVHIVEG